MEKKILTWYETPEVELVDVELDAQLLAGSPNPDNPLDDSTGDTEEME
jgi:hypothetical protein